MFFITFLARSHSEPVTSAKPTATAAAATIAAAAAATAAPRIPPTHGRVRPTRGPITPDTTTTTTTTTKLAAAKLKESELPPDGVEPIRYYFDLCDYDYDELLGLEEMTQFFVYLRAPDPPHFAARAIIFQDRDFDLKITLPEIRVELRALEDTEELDFSWLPNYDRYYRD